MDLKALYDKMSQLTAPLCRSECPRSYACCDSLYCEITIDWAKERYGTILQSTGHETLPLMGPDGCTAPPHMRPLCTLHVCSVYALGFITINNQPVETLTREYYKLREQIAELENLKHD